MIGSYKTIVNYYKEIFNITRYGDYTHAEILQMIPYEVEIFVALTLAALEEENQKREQAKNA